MSARSITAGLRRLFPCPQIETTGNGDGTYVIVLPERSASELGLPANQQAASGVIARTTGIPLTVTGAKPVKRHGGRFVAVTVKDTGVTA